MIRITSLCASVGLNVITLRDGHFLLCACRVILKERNFDHDINVNKIKNFSSYLAEDTYCYTEESANEFNEIIDVILNIIRNPYMRSVKKCRILAPK
jgi:hypothetical protein